MRPPEYSPRDLTDRVFRKTLENVHNLEEFLQEALPDHAAAFDYAHARLLPREFVAGDWRGREADLLYEIPYRTANGANSALVCVLLEHQSDTDVLMPFRTLFLTVAFWERQWRDWQQLPPPRPALRFPPVVPIVLYTGPTAWGSTRRMTDLLAEPAVFHSFAPTFEPLFWNLAEHTPDELLGRGDGWRNLLAVVRAARADAADFRRIVGEAVKHLEGIFAQDRPRWQELIEALLYWAYANRPRPEHAALRTAAEAELVEPIYKQEVHTVSLETSEYLYDQGMLQGLTKGRVEGRAEGQLLSLRGVLTGLLTKQFGALPDEIKQRIETTADPDRLQRAVIQVNDLKSLDELSL